MEMENASSCKCAKALLDAMRIEESRPLCDSITSLLCSGSWQRYSQTSSKELLVAIGTQDGPAQTFPILLTLLRTNFSRTHLPVFSSKGSKKIRSIIRSNLCSFRSSGIDLGPSRSSPLKSMLRQAISICAGSCDKNLDDCLRRCPMSLAAVERADASQADTQSREWAAIRSKSSRQIPLSARVAVTTLTERAAIASIMWFGQVVDVPIGPDPLASPLFDFTPVPNKMSETTLSFSAVRAASIANTESC
mmetsp:Transcript_51877/g.155695  ORF Transcript_51877/g.155695 Transcript_51877/m.155695 type:complete len:249 (+) Transcript_51877:824-1570(+)